MNPTTQTAVRNYLLGAIPGLAAGYILGRPFMGAAAGGTYSAFKYGDQAPGMEGLKFVTASIILVPLAAVKLIVRGVTS